MKFFLGIPVITGNGNKFTLINLAHYFKKMNPTKSIALVDLDFKTPYMAYRLSNFDKTHSIDNLIDKIDGNFLTKELFSENMITLKNGVDLLRGTKLLNAERLIKQKHIEYILKMLKKNYDYVFISAGNENTIALVNSILEASDIFVVLKNDYSNLLNLQNTLDFIENYKMPNTNIHFIINQFNEKSDIAFTQIIDNSKLSVKSIETIPYMEDCFDNLDLDKNNPVSKIFKTKNVSQETFNSILSKLT